jgi:hypothetical protein
MEGNMEKFIGGQPSPTEKEMEEARKKGPEAVKELEEKFKKAAGRKRLEETETAQKQLEKDFEGFTGKSPDEVQEMIDEEARKLERKE